MKGRANCIVHPNQVTAAAPPPFGNLLKRSKIGVVAPLPPLRGGSMVAAESDGDKIMLFARILAI
jgi:hypothetical protein